MSLIEGPTQKWACGLEYMRVERRRPTASTALLTLKDRIRPDGVVLIFQIRESTDLSRGSEIEDFLKDLSLTFYILTWPCM